MQKTAPYAKNCAAFLRRSFSDCRKTYITKRVVRPTPINPQKAATCVWLFALLKGGAPRWSGGRTAILSLVRCPDGHTFFAFLRTTGPARERSMGPASRWPRREARKGSGKSGGRTAKGCCRTRSHNRLSFHCPARQRRLGPASRWPGGFRRREETWGSLPRREGSAPISPGVLFPFWRFRLPLP